MNPPFLNGLTIFHYSFLPWLLCISFLFFFFHKIKTNNLSSLIQFLFVNILFLISSLSHIDAFINTIRLCHFQPSITNNNMNLLNNNNNYIINNNNNNNSTVQIHHFYSLFSSIHLIYSPSLPLNSTQIIIINLIIIIK